MSERLLLALETATDVASAAIGAPGEWTAQLTLVGAKRHAAALLPAVEQLLRGAGGGVTIGRLAGIVVGDGPGSFTGLRIAAATAKGLAQEHNLPLIAVPSLLGAALSASAAAGGGGPVAALYDALRGDVFVALYQFGERSVETLLAPAVVAASALPEIAPRPRVCVGDGAAAYPHICRRWSGRDPVSHPAAGPQAGWLLTALRYAELDRSVADPAAWEPVYGRPAEAQVRWERAHGRALPGSAG